MAAHRRKRAPITIFSILALLVLLIGGGLTVFVGFWHIDNWIRSGQRFDVGITQSVELPAGELVIFYESPAYLPAIHDQVHLMLRNEAGDRIEHRRVSLDEEEDYAPRAFLPMHSISGRPLWKAEIPAAGIYTIRVQNDHEEQDPVNDKIAIDKRPQSFKTLSQQNMQLKILGLALTGVLFVALYIMHGIALSRRAQKDAAKRDLDSAGMPLDDGGF